MQVRKHGWLFQIGHMFVPYSKQPARVDRCTLVWRFVAFFVPWLLASFFAWVALGLILGVFGHLVMWPWRFLIEARRPTFDGVDRLPLWLPARKALLHLCILSYGKKDIEWLEWMVRAMNPGVPRLIVYDGRLRSPAVFLIGSVLIVFLAYVLTRYAAPAAWHRLVLPAAGTVVHTFTVWVWVPIGIAALVGIRQTYLRFRSSEIGSVLIAHFKEWKRAHCPIYEVV